MSVSTANPHFLCTHPHDFITQADSLFCDGVLPESQQQQTAKLISLLNWQKMNWVECGSIRFFICEFTFGVGLV